MAIKQQWEVDKALSSTFSLDVERSLASILWHEPGYIDMVRAELDWNIHFTQPAIRIVVESISIVYGEIGEVDWTTVLHAIKEQGERALEACGGLEGLNLIYTDNGHWRDGNAPQPLVLEYIRLLKEYAYARIERPGEPFNRFLSGRGTLFKNKNRRTERDPLFTGNVSLAGKRYSARAWALPGGEAINISLSPL